MSRSNRSRRSRRPPPKRATRARALVRLLFKLSLVLALFLAGWLVYLDMIVTSRFEGQRWDVPSRVYARPLELYEGAPLTPAGLEWELQALGYQSAARLQGAGTYVRRGSRFDVHTRGFDFADGREPPRTVSLGISQGMISSWSGSDASGLVRLEPLQIGGIYPAHHEDRILVRLEDVPPLLTSALIEVEDRDFASHWGVAPISIVRAMVANLQAGRVVQGGSTLTQQLVKNFYLSHERSLMRKLNEAGMAFLLELHYGKDEILEAYLNEVFLGQSGRRAIHGFGLASQYYFGRELATLDVHHVALLVGLVKGATLYDPRRNPERALERRNLVIRILEEREVISASQAQTARNKPLDVLPKPSFTDNRYPAYVDLVRRHLARDYADEDLRKSGLRIFTALNPQVQDAAEKAVSETLKQVDGGANGGKVEGAVVVTGTENGEVLAMVSGRDARFAGFNRALDARRPIGSLIKPFVYLAALSDPARFTLISALQDEPVSLMAGGKRWEPRNYDRQAHGEVPLYRALANSYNLSTVRLGLDVGLERIISLLQALGVTQSIEPYPSLLLGTLELTPVEVTGLYQAIAANGFNTPLRTIRAVTTAEGEVLSRYNLSVEQVVDPRAVYLLQLAMQQVMREGTGRSAYNTLSSSLALAGKTGTTDNNRDSWFAGYGASYLAVAWMGRDDNEETRFTGSTGALRVWTRLMAALPQMPLETAQPDGIDYYWVDEREQSISAEGCAGARLMPFVSGSQPNRLSECADRRLHSPSSAPNWFERLFN